MTNPDIQKHDDFLALSHSGHWLNAIFRSMNDALIVVTPERKIQRLNPAAQLMFEYSEAELTGRSTEVLHVDQAHYLRFGDVIRTAFAKKESAQFRFQVKRKSGQIFPSQHTVCLLEDDQGNVLGKAGEKPSWWWRMRLPCKSYALLFSASWAIRCSVHPMGEAILLVEEQGERPDLILSDVVMPGMSGKTLVERLRKSLPGIKALYMSGYTDNAIVHHGILSPDTPFLQKPFTIKQLAQALQKLLEQ